MENQTAARLLALAIDAHDPALLADFWGSLLGWGPAPGPGDHPPDGAALAPSDDTGFGFGFHPARAPKSGPNQIHLHLTSQTPEQQQETVARVLELGGRHLDVGQLPEEGHIVLADPEGNELCVIEAGNRFLAGTGFLGELACDGTQEVGYFWSAALGWPLIWDQDQETGIRSPAGGPIIAWGGPPLEPRTGRNRMRFDLAPPAGVDLQTEVDRLVGLGATRSDLEPDQADAADRVVLADPDGNEFCLRS